MSRPLIENSAMCCRKGTLAASNRPQGSSFPHPRGHHPLPAHIAQHLLWVPAHQLCTVLAKETFQLNIQGSGAARPLRHASQRELWAQPGSLGQGPPPGLRCVCPIGAHRNKGGEKGALTTLQGPLQSPSQVSQVHRGRGQPSPTPGAHRQLREIADKPQQPGNGPQGPRLLVHFLRLHQARQDDLEREREDPIHTFHGSTAPSLLSLFSERGPLFIAVCGLIAVASLVAEHGL